MLATQVQYWTLQEAKRHNVAQDILGYINLEENKRHNIVGENETQRHNIAQEQYWGETIAETSRHNVAQEGYWTNSLQETIRHNYQQESLQGQQIEVERMNAYTNQINAATNRMNALTNQANAYTQRLSTEYNYDVGSRNARVGELNASTNRLNAEYNYNLGLKANEISGINADINQQNANTRWLEYTNSRSQAESRSRSVDIESTNALTNMYRANTERGKLDLGYSTLELSRKQFQWKKLTDLGDFYLKGLNTANSIYSNVLRTIQSNGG